MAKKEKEVAVEPEVPVALSREEVLAAFAKKLALGRASEGDFETVRGIGKAILREEEAAAKES